MQWFYDFQWSGPGNRTQDVSPLGSPVLCQLSKRCYGQRDQRDDRYTHLSTSTKSSTITTLEHPPNYNYFLLLTRTLINVGDQIVGSNYRKHTNLVWKLYPSGHNKVPNYIWWVGNSESQRPAVAGDPLLIRIRRINQRSLISRLWIVKAAKLQLLMVRK